MRGRFMRLLASLLQAAHAKLGPIVKMGVAPMVVGTCLVVCNNSEC